MTHQYQVQGVDGYSGTPQQTHEDLAGTGASLTEDDFTTIVMSSLLASYNTVTTSLYTSASMAKQQVSMEDIYRVIEEEYTKHQIQTRSVIPQASALAVHSKGS
jgi:hypothetical protein